MNEYSPVDAANSHWRRRTRPPASRLAPTTRVSPLLPPFSFLLPTTFAVFINYAPLSSSLRRENTSLSLFQLLPLPYLSVPLPSFRPLPPLPYLAYTSVFFYRPLLLSRSPLPLFLTLTRTAAYTRVIVAPTLEDDRRERMYEASHVRARAQRRGRSFIRSVRSFMPRPHVSTV